MWRLHGLHHWWPRGRVEVCTQPRYCEEICLLPGYWGHQCTPWITGSSDSKKRYSGHTYQAANVLKFAKVLWRLCWPLCTGSVSKPRLKIDGTHVLTSVCLAGPNSNLSEPRGCCPHYQSRKQAAQIQPVCLFRATPPLQIYTHSLDEASIIDNPGCSGPVLAAQLFIKANME